MRLLAVAGDIQALIAEIRLFTPLMALSQRTGWPLQLRSFHDCTRADLAAADVLIVQRGASRRAWNLQQTMRQGGGAVIYEIDDLLTEIAPHISQYSAVQAQQTWLLRCLGAADLVSVSTARLGAELGPLARAVAVVPNYALALGNAALPEPDPTRPVSLLFASSDHLDTPFIYAAVHAVAGPQVTVVVVGPPAAAFEAAGITVNRQPLMPRARFIEFARSLPNPLAVIPLEDTRFAACKSAIKWFDYAEAGIATLCSRVSPYADVVDDGVTGRLVANDAAAWQAALAAAIADAGWRGRVAVAARAAVRQRHMLETTVEAWRLALLAARQHSLAHPVPEPSLGWRLRQPLAAAFERALMGLRRVNRVRLARRQQRGR